MCPVTDAVIADVVVTAAADVAVPAIVDVVGAAAIAGGTAAAAGAFDSSSGGVQPGQPDPGTGSTFGQGGGAPPANPGWLSQVGSFLNSPGAKTLSTGLNIGSGLYGLYQSKQMQDMARSAFTQSNPFGPYRQQYAEQLARLGANPSSITGYPGYQFGFDQGSQAVQRAMAAQGYLGSGNEAIALQRYGEEYAGQFLSAEEARLANLAGASIGPNYGPALQGYDIGANTAASSLALLGYSGAKAFPGTVNATTPYGYNPSVGVGG